jgi:hypothetical protein
VFVCIVGLLARTPGAFKLRGHGVNAWLDYLPLSCNPLRPLATAAFFLLDRGTSDASERAEHTTIAALRAQQLFAMRAFVKIHAGIRRHFLFRSATARGAGDDGA